MTNNALAGPAPRNELESRFLDLFGRALDHASPSGREQRMAAFIRREVEQMGYAVEEDAARNLRVRLAGRDEQAAPAVFAAHMDEIGLVVTSVEPDGTLRIDRSGGLKPFKLGERALEFLGDHASVTGVVSLGGGHGAAAVDLQVWDGVKVITGLSQDALNACGVRVGTTAVPVREGRGPVLMGSASDPMVAAWTFDDRAGVCMLLMLLEALKREGVKPPVPVVIAFTVHEEGGCHGAKFLASRVQPDLFVAIDGCPYVPGFGFEVNELPTCWSKDSLGHYDQGMLAVLDKAARSADTLTQKAIISLGYSDATAVYNTGGAGKVACIGHARFNSHGFEVAKLGVFPNVVRTLQELFKMDSWQI